MPSNEKISGIESSIFLRRSWFLAAAALSVALMLCGVASLAPAFAEVARQSSKPLRVVTTFTILQDMAQNVAGTAAIVESVTKPGAEIHDYSPTRWMS